MDCNNIELIRYFYPNLNYVMFTLYSALGDCVVYGTPSRATVEQKKYVPINTVR